jgi:branched-subunit amino acid ABC-type transport system permease component
MQQVLTFALLGLGSGALIAGIALGVVLGWRGSGTINIAAGAMVMVAGYLFWAFRTGFFGVTLGTAAAMVTTMIAMGIVATVVEFVAVRPLRGSSPLSKLVASIGVLLVAQALVEWVFGTSPLNSPAVLPTSVIHLSATTVPVAQLILASVVILLALALAAAYRFSRFGLATRAASENEGVAVLYGLEPNTISLMNGILANLCAALVGVLAASITGINATTLPLLIIPALAAALFARFSSFLVATIAGLLIGVAESLLLYASTLSWFPTDHGLALPGIQQLLEFILIVLLLWWRGSSLPMRGDFVERSLPPVPIQDRLLQRASLPIGLCVLALVLLPSEFRQAVTTGLIMAILCLSFVVIMGYVGQLSVVQLALAGIAAFSLSHLGTDLGMGFPLAAILSVLVATVLGILIGVSALRIRGVTLVVVTLAASSAIDQFVFANPSWGGGQAGAPVRELSLFGLDLGPRAAFRGLGGSLPSPVFGFVALAITALLYIVVANLRRNDLGRQMLAIRSNERAAAAAGVAVASVKLQAFMISSAIAATAGVLLAYNYGTVSSSTFETSLVLTLLASVYVLGVTMPQAAVLAGFGATGAVIPLIMQKWIFPGNRVAIYMELMIGVGLLIQLRLFPEGLLVAAASKRVAKRKSKPDVRAGTGGSTSGTAPLSARARHGVGA